MCVVSPWSMYEGVEGWLRGGLVTKDEGPRTTHGQRRPVTLCRHPFCLSGTGGRRVEDRPFCLEFVT